MKSRTGAIERSGETAAINFERHLPHPVETVWRALTDPGQREKWLGPTTMEAGADGWIETMAEGPPVPPETRTVRGRILVWDPPSVLEHEWNQGIVGETVVRYELIPDGDGTMLRFSHRRLSPENAQGFIPGTHAYLDRLEAWLAGSELPDWSERYGAVQPSYDGEAAERYGVITEPGTIRFERMLPGPIERVWAYLTESEQRGKWLAAGDMDLRVGGRVELIFRHSTLSSEPTPEEYKKYEATQYGKITHCDPPQLLSFTWSGEPGERSEVTFELATRGDRVRMLLTHRHLGEERAMLLSVASGWHAHLAILEDNLAGAEPRGYWTAHEQAERAYDRRIEAYEA